MRRFIVPALAFAWILAGCQGPAPTPTSIPSPAVTVVVVVATPEATPDPTETPAPISSPAPTATFTLLPATPSLAPTRTPVRSTPTMRPSVAATAAATRPAATSVPTTAAAASTLVDGDYISSGSVRAQFTVSNGGTQAAAGFFSFHCEVDQALSTYGFGDAAPIAGGRFEFRAVMSASGAARVSMACTATSATQARCVINNLLATNKCPNTTANANHK